MAFLVNDQRAERGILMNQTDIAMILVMILVVIFLLFTNWMFDRSLSHRKRTSKSVEDIARTLLVAYASGKESKEHGNDHAEKISDQVPINTFMVAVTGYKDTDDPLRYNLVGWME